MHRKYSLQQCRHSSQDCFPGTAQAEIQHMHTYRMCPACCTKHYSLQLGKRCNLGSTPGRRSCATWPLRFHQLGPSYTRGPCSPRLCKPQHQGTARGKKQRGAWTHHQHPLCHKCGQSNLWSIWTTCSSTQSRCSRGLRQQQPTQGTCHTSTTQMPSACSSYHLSWLSHRLWVPFLRQICVMGALGRAQALSIMQQ